MTKPLDSYFQKMITLDGKINIKSNDIASLEMFGLKNCLEKNFEFLETKKSKFYLLGNILYNEIENFSEMESRAFMIGQVNELLNCFSTISKLNTEYFLNESAKNDETLSSIILIVGQQGLISHKDLSNSLGKKPNNLSNYMSRNILWRRFVSFDTNPMKKNSIFYYLNSNGLNIYQDLKITHFEYDSYERLYKNWESEIILGGLKNGKIEDFKDDCRIKQLNSKIK